MYIELNNIKSRKNIFSQSRGNKLLKGSFFKTTLCLAEEGGFRSDLCSIMSGITERECQSHYNSNINSKDSC